MPVKGTHIDFFSFFPSLKFWNNRMQFYSVPVHTGQLLCQQAKQVHITSFISAADAKLLLLLVLQC
jgi:hypothetical protein